MLRITQSFRPEPDYRNEDLYFCSNMQDSEKLPSEEVAKHFSREGFSEQERSSSPTIPSVGIHNLWLTPDDIRRFFEGQCPGVSLACHGLHPAQPAKGALNNSVHPKRNPLTTAKAPLSPSAKTWSRNGNRNSSRRQLPC